MNIPINLPQELLDKIHEADIAELCGKLDQLNASQKKAEIKLARAKLNAAKKQVRLEQDGLLGRFDGRNAEHKALKSILAAPFDLLEQFIGEIEVGLTEVEAGREPHTLLYLCQRRFIGGNVLTGQWGIDKLDSMLTFLDRIIGDIDQRTTMQQAQKGEAPFGWIGWGMILFACMLGSIYLQSHDATILFGTLVLAGLGLPFAIYRRKSSEQIAQQRSLATQKEILQQQAERLKKIAAVIKPPVTVQYPQPSISSTPDNIQVLQQQLQAAKALIDAKNYRAARSLLGTINHPKAKEWLAKMDERGL